MLPCREREESVVFGILDICCLRNQVFPFPLRLIIFIKPFWRSRISVAPKFPAPHFEYFETILGVALLNLENEFFVRFLLFIELFLALVFLVKFYFKELLFKLGSSKVFLLFCTLFRFQDWHTNKQRSRSRPNHANFFF